MAPSGRLSELNAIASSSGSEPANVRFAVSPTVIVTVSPFSIVGRRFTLLTVILNVVDACSVPSFTKPVKLYSPAWL